MKKISLYLLFMFIAHLFVQPEAHANISSINPNVGANNITIHPQIKVTFSNKLDTSKLWKMSPVYYIDTFTVAKPNVLLLRRQYRDSIPDSLHSLVAEQIYIQRVDSNSILLLTRRALKENTEYSLIIKGLKLLRPSTIPGTYDTVSVDTTIVSLFTTALPLPSIISKSFDPSNSMVNPCDNFVLTLDRKLPLSNTNSTLADIFTLQKQGSDIDSGVFHKTIFNNVPVTISINSDSTQVTINPNTDMTKGLYYLLKYNLSRLTGNPADNREFAVLVKSKAYYKLSTASVRPLDTLPASITPEIGTGEFSLQGGDTLRNGVPLIKDNYYLVGWICPNDPTYGTKGKDPNIFEVINNCNLKDKHITALYDKVPIDTLTVQPCDEIDANGNTIIVGYTRVIGFKDSLGNGRYTYDRYSYNQLLIEAVSTIPGYKFSHWGTNDGNNNSEQPRCTIRSDKQIDINAIFNQPGTGRRYDPHFDPVLEYPCNSYSFNINVEYETDPEFPGLDVRTMFNTLTFDIGNGVKVPVPALAGSYKNATSTVTVPMNGSSTVSVLIEGLLNDPNYQISSIWDDRNQVEKGERFSKRSVYEKYLDRLGLSMAATLTGRSPSDNCRNTLHVFIRRKFYSYEVKMAVVGNKPVPSTNIASFEIKPVPPKQINFPPFLWTRIYSEYTNSNVFFPLNRVPEQEGLIKITDANGRIVEIRRKVNYYVGTSINVYPKIYEQIGFSLDHWQDAPPFTKGNMVNQNTQEISIVMNADKSSEFLLSEDFRLVHVWLQKPTSYNVVNNEKVLITNEDDKYKVFKIDNDVNDEHKMLASAADFNEGVGLLHYMENGFRHSKIREFHQYSTIVKFVFNDEVDAASAANNMYIKDIDVNLNQEDHRRVDNNLPSKYSLRFVPNEVFGTNNCNAVIANAEGFTNNAIEMLLTSDYEGTKFTDQHWMSHLSKFAIFINNDRYATDPSTRIHKAHGPNEPIKPLANCLNSSNGAVSYQIVTAVPGITVKAYELGSTDHADTKFGYIPNAYVHCVAALMDLKGLNVNTDKENYGYDNYGRLIYKVATNRFPSGSGTVNLFDGYYNSDIILTDDILRTDDCLNISFHMIDKNDGDLAELWEGVATIFIENSKTLLKALDQYIKANTEEKIDIKLEDIWNNPDVVKFMKKCWACRDDRTIATVNFYLTRDHNGLNSNYYPRYIKENGTFIDKEEDWSLYGSGKHGLYRKWYVRGFSEETGYDALGCLDWIRGVDIVILEIIVGDIGSGH